MRLTLVACLTCLALTGQSVYAQSRGDNNDPANRLNDNQARETQNEVSPARRIERRPGERPPRGNQFETRSIDGSNNNENNPEIGAAHIQLQRYTDVGYSDGISSLAGEERPSARAVSNAIFSQTGSLPNSRGASDFLWQWGQFLDHDIDLTDGVDPAEAADISVPTGDIFFDPNATGTVTMSLNRSLYDTDTGTGINNPRQQINEITSWIDASNVYGSDSEREAALRTFDGDGKLKVSDGNLLPFNTEGLPNAGGSLDTLFLAGDVRANEQTGLTAMHTLFVREHNRLAERIRRDNPSLNGDEIYQQARKIVGAQMQVITYNEFLPTLLGRNALRRYRGYNPDVDASIANEFSTAAYRFGHSLLGEQILRLDAQGNEIAAGNLALRDAFFRPSHIIDEGLEPVFRGLAAQTAQTIDSYVIDDVRNFLFGQPGSGGFDLVSLNIQRGRDHGLPSYNDARRAMGLEAANSFADVSGDPEVQQRLADAYESVEDIDLWVGGLAEDHYRNAMVGELYFHILRRQFEALRDGDRFWYQNYLSPREIRRVENTTLADIIRRNTNIGRELQPNVFLAR